MTFEYNYIIIQHTDGNYSLYAHLYAGSITVRANDVVKQGQVIGKMGHSERQGKNRNKNIYGEMDQKLFEAGVAYFK